MGSDREWDDVEIEVYNQLLQHRFTPIISEVEDLYQVVPLATGWTLGMTLRPRRGGSDSGGSKDRVRMVKGFGLLRIRIFGYCGIWVPYL